MSDNFGSDFADSHERDQPDSPPPQTRTRVYLSGFGAASVVVDEPAEEVAEWADSEGVEVVDESIRLDHMRRFDSEDIGSIWVRPSDVVMVQAEPIRTIVPSHGNPSIRHDGKSLVIQVGDREFTVSAVEMPPKRKLEVP